MGDILLEVNEEPLDTREEFIIMISSLKPGDEAKIHQRNDAQMSVKVTLGVRPQVENEFPLPLLLTFRFRRK